MLYEYGVFVGYMMKKRFGLVFFFFFSSRRRHTRWTGDWSSDVCSSDLVSWRLVFLINVPLAVAVVLVALRHVPESRDPAEVEGFDLAGALLTVLALVGLGYGLVAWGSDGLSSGTTWRPLVLGVLAAVAFVAVEQRSPHPMLPLEVFSSRLFTVVNVVTFLVYAALGGIFFLLVLTLQVAAGFTPIQAGTA